MQVIIKACPFCGHKLRDETIIIIVSKKAEKYEFFYKEDRLVEKKSRSQDAKRKYWLLNCPVTLKKNVTLSKFLSRNKKEWENGLFQKEKANVFLEYDTFSISCPLE